MPSVTRQDDLCSGHGCWPPRSNTSWSTNVFVNSKGFHRYGDGWGVHCCPCSPPCCHAGVLVGGSTMVNVNSRPAARIGDPISCGSACAQGSGNVYAGG